MRIAIILGTLLVLSIVTSVVDAQVATRQRRLRRSRLDRFDIRRACNCEPSRNDASSEIGSVANESGSDTKSLFNGTDLTGWEIIKKYDFERHGKITVEDEAIVLGAGTPATGIRVAGDFPKINYEVTLDAKRISGSDFFCGITFPVGDDFLSLVLGGWGGGTTGISNLDGMSAVDNHTTGFQDFEQDRWYQIRLSVTEDKVEAWIDDEQIVDVQHKDHKLSIWWEQEPVRPFGFASWYTKSALRNVQLRRMTN